MGGFSLIHWVIVIGIVMILFGKGRISDVMSDVAKGIRSFRKGLNEEDNAGAGSTPPAPPEPRLPEPRPSERSDPIDVTPPPGNHEKKS